MSAQQGTIVRMCARIDLIFQHSLHTTHKHTHTKANFHNICIWWHNNWSIFSFSHHFLINTIWFFVVCSFPSSSCIGGARANLFQLHCKLSWRFFSQSIVWLKIFFDPDYDNSTPLSLRRPFYQRGKIRREEARKIGAINYHRRRRRRRPINMKTNKIMTQR